MMKITLVSFAVLAVGLASALPNYRHGATYGLKEDFDKFIALIPTDKVLAIGLDYLANDAEVQEALEFIQSSDFKNLILEIEAIPEYRNFLKYLQDNGLNVYYYIQMLHDALELPAFVPSRSLARRGTGVRGLIDDIKAELPLDKIKALYYETLETSEAFRSLVDLMKSDELKGVVQKLRANPNFQEVIKRLKDHGVDIELIIDLLNKIFGWGIETRRSFTYGLQDDLQDFLALIDKDQIIAIAFDYLANDPEVQEASEYVQSEEFKQLVKDVDSIPEYINTLNMLQKQGLDVYKVVNAFHELLGLPTLPTPSAFRRLTRRGTGIRGLIDDIEAILPIEEIKALYYQKLQNSPDFANLVAFLKTDEFKTVVSTLRAKPEFQEIVQRAKQHGVDVALIIEILNKIFGWGIETRRSFTYGLQDDLQDFLALIDKDQIIAIAFDYLANDPEVQEASEYVQSEEFKQLVKDVDSIPEYINTLNMLQKQGLDVYKVVNAFHELLGLPTLPIPSAFRRLTRRGTGIRGLIDDIEAILPIEEIKALYYQKMQNSPDFINLVGFLKADEFKTVVSTLRAKPEFQEIVQRAKQHGVDVALIIEILNKIFGWGIEN